MQGEGGRRGGKRGEGQPMITMINTFSASGRRIFGYCSPSCRRMSRRAMGSPTARALKTGRTTLIPTGRERTTAAAAARPPRELHARLRTDSQGRKPPHGSTTSTRPGAGVMWPPPPPPPPPPLIRATRRFLLSAGSGSALEQQRPQSRSVSAWPTGLQSAEGRGRVGLRLGTWSWSSCSPQSNCGGCRGCGGSMRGEVPPPLLFHIEPRTPVFGPFLGAKTPRLLEAKLPFSPRSRDLSHTIFFAINPNPKSSDRYHDQHTTTNHTAH